MTSVSSVGNSHIYWVAGAKKLNQLFIDKQMTAEHSTDARADSHAHKIHPALACVLRAHGAAQLFKMSRT